MELWIVARSLGIEDTGTKDSIFRLIDEHLKEHPELKTQECFAGLFLPKGTRAKQPAVSQTTPEIVLPNDGLAFHQQTNPPVFPPGPSFLTPTQQTNFYAHIFLSDSVPYNYYDHPNVGSSTNPSHYFTHYPHQFR